MSTRARIGGGLAGGSILSVALVMNACATQPVTGTVEVLHAAPHCPGDKQRQVRLLEDQSALDALWRRGIGGPAANAPTPDFSRKLVIYLADSEKPTAGYGLRLSRPEMTVSCGVAAVHIETSEPVGYTAQMISRPCLLLALPDGDYERLDVLDREGRVWATLQLKRWAE
jgi:hypothetical protein